MKAPCYLIFYSTIILTLMLSGSSCQNIKLFDERGSRILDVSYIATHDSIRQILTTNGIEYHNVQHERVDLLSTAETTINNITYGPSQMLYFDQSINSLLLIQEVYDPHGYDDESIMADSIQFTDRLQNVRFLKFNAGDSHSVFIDNIKDRSQEYHLISSSNDETNYFLINKLNENIEIKSTNTIVADRILYDSTYYIPIFIQSGLHGLLAHHKIAEFNSIDPFQYNYARAQHSSGVWGYLKRDGTWFPDE